MRKMIILAIVLSLLLVSPVWNYTLPRPVYAFLDEYDLSSKRIILFGTNAGSDFADQIACIQRGEPEATAEDSIDRKPDEKTSFSETEQSEIPENTVKGEEQSKTSENEGVITVEKALVLSIDGQEIPVSWEDNDSVKEIMEQSLKDTILVDMHQYGGWEQVGSLGRAYSRNDTQITAQNGDIVLYSGNQIVLFYGSNSWAYTKLGHIMLSEEDITALLNKNSVSLTIEMK